MNPPFNIVVLVGSLRRESLTRKVVRAMIALAPTTLGFRELPLGDLAMYNEDIEGEPPEPWTRFRAEVKAADGVLFATPEYNRSVPAVLKNAIDIGSRPAGRNAWAGKAGAVVSVTPHGLGAFGANHHLRQALVYVNVPVMAQPEAYVSNAAKLFDDSGALNNDTSRALFTRFMAAFAEWVRANAPKAGQ